MCGIYAIVSRSKEETLPSHIERCLRNRGPDRLDTVQVQLAQPDGENGLHLSFTSTVLALRGDHVVTQPLRDEEFENILCWNGEAWKFNGQLVTRNDGELILAALRNASAQGQGPDEIHARILGVFRVIEGPFSFVYLHKPTNTLYYGRDRLGRRSLLMKSDSARLILSSIADPQMPDWVEVEADGLYSIDLGETTDLDNMPKLTRHDWTLDSVGTVSGIGPFNSATPSQDTPRLSQDLPAVAQVRQHLEASLKLRVTDIPVAPNASSSDTRVAVLFSGGLDCTILARLASDLVPRDQAIDLLNVAFENPRIAQQHRERPPAELFELCPDRITGRKSFSELVRACPERTWRFVTLNVPYSETLLHRQDVVHLIHPHNTEMDLSIAFALYFASRGQGVSVLSPESNAPVRPYRTTARVLLSGLGADELFGGYSRHSAAFSRQGYSGLVEELQLDVSRLGKRNLGRDDRVMAHWGREVRFPYLDEEFVRWAIQLPVWEKCDFANQDIAEDPEPGKRLLRFLARDIGLTSVAQEKKRAIQFGARTAKMESGKVKGTTVITS